MIQTIEGKIGGGKTYTAMGWICNHLSKGGVVATNINIQVDAFTDQYGKKMGIREVMRKYYAFDLQDCQVIHLSDVRTVDYPTKKGIEQLNEIVMFYKLVPRGTPDMPLLVVIDEAHIHFPQDGYRNIPREVLNFLTLSRHACVDVVFISQHVKNMWCQMTRLSEYRWAVRDMKKYGLPFGWFNMIWPFPHYLKNKYDSDGTVMERQMEWARKYLYETYKSPEIVAAFESMKSAARVDVKKGKLTMNEKIMFVAFGLLVGVMLVAVPACVTRKEQPEILAAPSTLPKKYPISVKQGKQPLENEEIEYYCGYVDNGWDSKLFTNLKTYHIGDPFQGKHIALIRKNEVILIDMETKETSSYFLPKKPSDI